MEKQMDSSRYEMDPRIIVNPSQTSHSGESSGNFPSVHISMQNLAEMSKDTGWTPKRSEKEGFANASV